MSPHAVWASALGSDETTHGVDFNKFAVTQNAFLPATSPPTSLSDSYYEPWDLLAQNLPSLIESNHLRDAVKQLPVLTTDRLQSEAEWRRAYTILAFLTHAYVWAGDLPEQILPPQITLPFLRVSNHLELPPVLTYAGACLWNFSCAGDDFSNLDNLSLPISFTGSQSESWFLLLSVAVEAQAAGILQTMVAALEAVKTRDYGVITAGLVDLRRCIESVGALLERMYEKCDPMVFYHQIRPFLAGSMNMEAAGLPKGVFYDQGDGVGEWRQFRGGSNGQSSLIQFFDVILGVEHLTHGSAGKQSFHTEVREYMPGPHRRFLIQVARMGSIRELALLEPTSEEQHQLRHAYMAATDALTDFRNKHIQIVTRYIIVPSRQPRPSPSVSRQNLASSSSSCTRRGQEGLMGTGGTQLIPFLRTSRDETCHAAQLQREPPSP